MNPLSPYRLTVIASVVVLVLSVGVVTVLGGAQNATSYLGLVGTVAVPGLFTLFRAEQNAQLREEQHAQNQADINETNSKIDQLAQTLAKKDGV